MKPVLPGSTIGVLGAGQLGRMFAIAARKMGYRVHTFSPDTDTPTGQISDVEIVSSYDDLDRVREFARGVSVITFEFENVPAATASTAAEWTAVRPRGEVLHVTQNRAREKAFLTGAGFPVAPFAAVDSLADLQAAAAQLGCPAILKTAGFGYDGKGQYRLRSAADCEDAWESVGRTAAVLESFVDFELEISVVAARGTDGSFAHYGAIQNAHVDGILDVSVWPAGVEPRVERDAVAIARDVLEALDVVGVLCIEFFLTRDGRLLINELAPRPHNSGHLTFDACVTSQFEQQLRAVCGLPLGSTDYLCPAAMANLLGDIWVDCEPDWAAVVGFDHVKLHLYGKTEARPGRKMGHLTALGPNAEARAREARSYACRNIAPVRA